MGNRSRLFRRPKLLQRKAFTLIELLVVIAIIAILAAILFPVFARAKDAAKKTVEITHLKQLGTATMIYGADYDDNFPLAYNYPSTGPAGGFPWSLSIYPYVKSYGIYLSPAGKPNAVTNSDWEYIWSFGTVPRSEIKLLPYYTVSDYPITRALNVVGARMQGVMGMGQAGNVWGCWGAYCGLWSGEITVPSKSQGELSSVSEQAMIFSAGEPFGDFLTFGQNIELGTCTNGRSTYNPGNASIAGATPRWNGGPRSCTGWREAGGGGSATIPDSYANKIKEGSAVVIMADTSGRTMAMTQLYRTEACQDDPNARCMVHFRG